MDTTNFFTLTSYIVYCNTSYQWWDWRGTGYELDPWSTSGLDCSRSHPTLSSPAPCWTLQQSSGTGRGPPRHGSGLWSARTVQKSCPAPLWGSRSWDSPAPVVQSGPPEHLWELPGSQLGSARRNPGPGKEGLGQVQTCRAQHQTAEPHRQSPAGESASSGLNANP